MSKSVLIIGEDPAGIDFDAPDAPPITADEIRAGLEGSRDRLVAKGYQADILWTLGIDSLAERVDQALTGKAYDVFVIGAGLRTLPPMRAEFEWLVNLLHARAPATAFAFNEKPSDSDEAALRVLKG